MSAAAESHFQAIVDLYLAAGSPARQSWLFQAGRVSDVQRELEAAALIERVFGTKRGFAWRLTERGVEQAATRG